MSRNSQFLFPRGNFSDCFRKFPKHLPEISRICPGNFPELSWTYPGMSSTFPGHFPGISRTYPRFALGIVLAISWKFPEHVPEKSWHFPEVFLDMGSINPLDSSIALGSFFLFFGPWTPDLAIFDIKLSAKAPGKNPRNFPDMRGDNVRNVFGKNTRDSTINPRCL